MAISECVEGVDGQGRELMQHGTAAFPFAAYHDDLEKLEVAWHWHEELELILVSRGTMAVSAGNMHYLLGKGQGLFINSGILHACKNGGMGACRLHSIVFHPRLVGGSLDSVFWTDYVTPLLKDVFAQSVLLDGGAAWGRQALEALENAWQACREEKPGFEFRTREEMSRLIFLLSGGAPERKYRPSKKELRDQERIKKMLVFIREHLSDELRIGEIADSAAVSVSECLRCFHGTLGTTPIQYVKSERLRTAAELLSGTDCSVSDIALQCGFQEMSYFARMFREAYGCAPREYRRSGV